MELDDCGCCEQKEAPVARVLSNPPGLSKLSYRIGRFGQFKQAMKNSLVHERSLGPWPLDRLTTRDDSDPVIATIDAWAVVLDVLCFYQERIASENYLRTCTEYRSVVELGTQVGYRPAPGTAATAYVAFKVDDSTYGPASVRVDAGAKIQSQPGQDELPQIYETQEAVVARPEYNAMPVRTHAPKPLASGDQSAFFAGSDFDIKLGDRLLFIATDASGNPDPTTTAVTQVTAIVRDSKRKVTELTWGALTWSAALVAGAEIRVFAMRLKVAMFGASAVPWAALPRNLRIGEENYPGGTVLTAGAYATRGTTWADADLTTSDVPLDAIYSSIVADSWVVLQTSSGFQVRRVTAATDVVVDDFAMSGKVTQLTLDTTPTNVSPKTATVLAQSERLSLAEAPIVRPLDGAKVELGVRIERCEKGRKLVIRGKRPRVSFDVDSTFVGKTGASSTLPNGEVCALTAAPETAASGQRFYLERAHGARGHVDIDPAHAKYAAASSDDSVLVGETVEVAEDQSGASDDPTEILVTKTLAFAYDRESTKVYANVAYATHGETKREVLGGGNASIPFQRFELREAPLTYLASPTDTGYESTVSVRVNRVLWHEEPTLYGLKPNDRDYTVRQDDRQKTTIGFGDGKTGARTETGVENVTATYRVGSGLKGRVRADQLNMPLTRPLGLMEVNNPLAASGGSDPESATDARRNAPKSILTLGRIVSVRDFEDHAARYPGISKAQAKLVWRGAENVVHLTVSGPGGEGVDGTNLRGSIDSVRDVHFPVVVQSVETVTFALSLEVRVQDDFLFDDVALRVKKRLEERFGFEARVFSEAVTVSQIDAEVQQVRGVEAANVLVLDFSTTAAPTRADALRIKSARYVAPEFLPAQILVIDTTKLRVEEMHRDL